MESGDAEYITKPFTPQAIRDLIVNILGEADYEENFDDRMDKKDTMACRLAFTGDASGNLVLLAPEGLVAEMAENFMGESRDQLTSECLSGTLTEMLNMVCGNALSKIDSKDPFELGIPERMDRSKISGKEVFTIVVTTESKMAVWLKMD